MSRSEYSTSVNEPLNRDEDYGIECLLTLPIQINDLRRVLKKHSEPLDLEDLIEAIFQASMFRDGKLELSEIYEHVYENCGYSPDTYDFTIEHADVDVLIKIAEEIYHQHVVFLHEEIEAEESLGRSKFSFARFRLLRNLVHVEATLEFRAGAS